MNQHQVQIQRVNQQGPPPQMSQTHQQPPLMGQMSATQPSNPMMLWSHNMPPPNPITFPPPMSSNNPQLYSTPRNWKGKKPMDINRKESRRKDKSLKTLPGSTPIPTLGGLALTYQPPTLFELEHQNRLKSRRFYHPKKKFNRMAPYAHAPRNTTSYLIRAKKAGGIASLVSPCPVTPAVLPTPVFSPSRESLVDMAKEEWGVDGYGSMKGLIRLRSPGHDEPLDDYDDDDDDASSESDVEEHVEVERRLDHDLSRFEMIYPNTGVDYHNVLENRVDDQDTHIAQLEEENLILKERLYLMERELGELRRRLLCLERQNQVVEDINEEVVENVSENDSEGLRNVMFLGGNNKHNEEVDYAPRDEAGESEMKRDDGEDMLHKGLSELVVKDAFDGNAPGDDSKGVALAKGKQDVGLVNDNEEHVVDSMVKTNSEQVQGLNVEQAEEEYNKKKSVGLVDGGTEVVVGESVKSRPDVDACMGETINKQVSKCDQPEGMHKETGKDDEAAGTQSTSDIGTVNNIEAATDVSMEDVSLMNKDD